MRALILALLLPACSTADDALQQIALPVTDAQRFAQAMMVAFPFSDLDGDGSVPTSLIELNALIRNLKIALESQGR